MPTTQPAVRSFSAVTSGTKYLCTVHAVSSGSVLLPLPSGSTRFYAAVAEEPQILFNSTTTLDGVVT